MKDYYIFEKSLKQNIVPQSEVEKIVSGMRAAPYSVNIILNTEILNKKKTYIATYNAKNDTLNVTRVKSHPLEILPHKMGLGGGNILKLEKLLGSAFRAYKEDINSCYISALGGVGAVFPEEGIPPSFSDMSRLYKHIHPRRVVRTPHKLYSKTRGCRIEVFRNTDFFHYIRGGNAAPVGEHSEKDNYLYDMGEGICSGMTTTWIYSFISYRTESRTPDARIFNEFFDSVLRFNGAELQYYYIKRNWGLEGFFTPITFPGIRNVRVMNLANKDLLNKENVKQILNNTFMRIDEIRGNLSGFSMQKPLAAYIGVGRHVFGLGFYDKKYYIMDSNMGLACYLDEGEFYADLTVILEHYINNYIKKVKLPNLHFNHVRVFLFENLAPVN